MDRPVKAGELFTTFIFDGKDCADMGVYSITSSGTYTTYIEPTFKDEVLEVPAYDGRYYYGSQYSIQQFQFNLFADNLSLTEYRNLKTWLNPRNVGKLILSDQPYKYYIVKVTSISALNSYPLTDIQTPSNSVLGDYLEGNVVYTGKFTVTFQTVGSVYGYGLSYYRDDLIYDAKDKYGPGVYSDNYYYDSGLLYKDMSPLLTKTVPANAKNFDLTIYNPGSATAIPTINIISKLSYPEGSILEIINNTLNTYTMVDIGGLQGELELDMEGEVVIDSDGKNYFGRFSGNQFEIGEETSVINIPESFVESVEDFYVKDYDSIYVINDENGDTWAHINPLVFKVSDDLIDRYFCINGNGGARIKEVDMTNNRLLLNNPPVTYEILPAIVDSGAVIRPSGMEFRYVGKYSNVEELPEGNIGDVASIEKVMYLFRNNKWSITNLFTDPSQFDNLYGDKIPQYLIFGANIIELNDIKINTNFGECDISVSLLPRYL